MVSMNLTTRVSVDMSTVRVRAPPLKVPRPFEVRHLQRDAFGHARVLYGS